MIKTTQLISERPFLLLLLLSLTSCASLDRVAPNENRKILSDKNFEILNGDYKADANLAGAFFSKIHKVDTTAVMNLQFIDKGSVKVTLLKQDTILDERIVKGKIRQDYFKARLSYDFSFWFIIINGLGITRTRIGLLNNTNLTVDTVRDGMGLLVVIPVFSSGGALYGLEYERLELSAP
jgi:hypothetical protein